MTEKILLVDDDPRVLEALRTVLRRDFLLRTAIGPEAGLEALSAAGPFAVVVSDLKMPGMNGIEFLARVREIAPDTVRVVLTGHADVDSAIAAVNRGEVFRFHTKPCPAGELRQTLTDALAKYRLAHIGSFPEASSNLSRVVESEDRETSRPLLGEVLTAKELRVADLIRRDAVTKDIAAVLNVSVRTVETHRENIRRKLGIANRRINLQAFLKVLLR